jgi:hypothetical protein
VSLLRKVEDLDFTSSKLRDDLGYKDIYSIVRLPASGQDASRRTPNKKPKLRVL